MSGINNTTAADTASGVVLTLQGEQYCEAQRQALIRSEAQEIIEASLDLVERMLRVIDRLDPDPEMEEGGDLEPNLGWPAGHGLPQLRKDMCHDDEREEENEHGGDVLDGPHDANTSEDMEYDPGDCPGYPNGSFIPGGGSQV